MVGGTVISVAPLGEVVGGTVVLGLGCSTYGGAAVGGNRESAGPERNCQRYGAHAWVNTCQS